jgi:hypothetical protein
VINISQAPLSALTPEQQLARDKFDFDKEQALNNALQLQQAMRYGGLRSGGGGYGGGRMPSQSYVSDPYAGWNRVSNWSLPGTQYTGSQGNVRAMLPAQGGVRQLVAPPGLSDSRLGTWAEQQLKQAVAEGKAPPQIVQDIRS